MVAAGRAKKWVSSLLVMQPGLFFQVYSIALAIVFDISTTSAADAVS
jgi:hypothetical protein